MEWFTMDAALLDTWINDFNLFIDGIVKSLYQDQKLKQIIAKIKKDMFENNTHNWSSLKESTINKKRNMARLGYISESDVEKPNIRTRDLVSAFSNAVNIEISQDLEISYNLNSEQRTKVKNVQQFGRDPEEFTEAEFQAIVEYIISDVLVVKIKEKYNA